VINRELRTARAPTARSLRVTAKGASAGGPAETAPLALTLRPRAAQKVRRKLLSSLVRSWICPRPRARGGVRLSRPPQRANHATAETRECVRLRDGEHAPSTPHDRAPPCTDEHRAPPFAAARRVHSASRPRNASLRARTKPTKPHPAPGPQGATNVHSVPGHMEPTALPKTRASDIPQSLRFELVKGLDGDTARALKLLRVSETLPAPVRVVTIGPPDREPRPWPRPERVACFTLGGVSRSPRGCPHAGRSLS
jgi:hypothetical protein